VVSRGGRPDLVGARLARVTAPTLLIVGGDDEVVLRLNRAAAAELGGPHGAPGAGAGGARLSADAGRHRVEVVPGATHLFEEPGALEAAARLAADWFLDHL